MTSSAHRALAVDAFADDVGVAGVLADLGEDVQRDAAHRPADALLEPGCRREGVPRIEVGGREDLLGGRGDVRDPFAEPREGLLVAEQEAIVLPFAVRPVAAVLVGLGGDGVPVDVRLVDPGALERRRPGDGEAQPLLLGVGDVLEQGRDRQLDRKSVV